METIRKWSQTEYTDPSYYHSVKITHIRHNNTYGWVRESTGSHGVSEGASDEMLVILAEGAQVAGVYPIANGVRYRELAEYGGGTASAADGTVGLERDTVVTIYSPQPHVTGWRRGSQLLSGLLVTLD